MENENDKVNAEADGEFLLLFDCNYDTTVFCDVEGGKSNANAAGICGKV